MSSTEEKNINKIIEFDGKGFKIWARKFLARANRKGYKKLLTGTTPIPTIAQFRASEDEANDAKKTIVKNWNLNELAFEDLLLSINTKTSSGTTAFNLVDTCTSSDQPDGNCKIAWDRLVSKYQPKTAPSYIQLKKDFANSRLKDLDVRPDEWMSELESLRSEMNKVTIAGKSDMTEVDVIIHILSNLPEEYEVAVSELENKLRNTSIPLDMEEVRIVLGNRYNRITKNAENAAQEKAFAAFQKQYKGTCRKCGEYGHKSENCPNNKTSPTESGTSTKSKKFKGNCNYCHKWGHKAVDCRKKKSDLAKKQEKAKLAVGNEESEVEDYLSEEESYTCELGLVTIEEVPELVPRSDKDSDEETDTEDEDEDNTVRTVLTSDTQPAEETALKCLVDGKEYPSFTSKTAYGDTGASTHMRKSLEGMYDLEEINENIGGVGGGVKATRKGKFRGLITQANGDKAYRNLDCVKYAAGLQEDLFSITAELTAGAKISNDENNNIGLTYKDGTTIKFDRRVKTKDGWVAGVDVEPATNETAMVAFIRTVDINEYHRELGHPSEGNTRATAKLKGIRLTGEFKPCKDCAVGKSKQKKISKEPKPRSKVRGEKLLIDISSPKTRSIGGKNHWLLIMDDYTDQTWSKFLKEKSELGDVMIEFILELKNKHGIDVKIIRCDNSGENNAFEKQCKSKGMGITFEYTAPGTPQQNGRVERKFATLYGRLRSMLENVENPNLRDKLWAEAANTATVLDTTLAKKGRNQSSFQQFFGKGESGTVPNFSKIFGEKVIIANRNKLKSKLEPRGKQCLWLGYADLHSKDTHRIYNPETRSLILSRDVTFLRKDSKYSEVSETIVIPSEKPIKTPQEAPSTEPTKIPSKIWVREDRNMQRFLTTLKNGPSWDYVTGRATYDLDSGKEIENVIINKKTQEKYLHRQLPKNVKNIRTILYHEDPTIPNMKVGNIKPVSDTESDSDNDTVPPLIAPTISDDEDSSDDESEEEQVEDVDTDASGENQVQNNKKVCFKDSNAKAVRAMKILSGVSYNPEAERIVQSGTTRRTRSADARLGRASYRKEVAKAMTSSEKVSKINDAKLPYEEPKTYEQAWNHQDPVQRKKWREAIVKERGDMETRVVWKRVKRSNIPNNKRCVKCKWVFKIKRDGTFRARLVACGYSQIPGVDFSENYSPVVHDITVRLLFVIMIMLKLTGKIADVETAFLWGDLEEEVYMDNPPGLPNAKEDEALLLLQTIYGLVQSARQYYKKARSILLKIGFTGGTVDPCLFHRKTEKGLVFIGLFVDDNLLIGHPEAIEDAIQGMRKHGFTLKIQNDLRDYLSCEVRFNSNKTMAWLGQPHLIKNLRKRFGHLVKNLRSYKTPGTPNTHMIRNETGSTALSKSDASLYRSGVGMLLYLVKYSRPDIANPVRELSKVLDCSTKTAFKELLRMIKYVLDTEDLGLKISPKIQDSWKPWDLVCYSDSDYAGDPDTRRSVSGYVLFVQGVPVSWRSKANKTVTLSSTEAEWIALSEAVKEVMFVVQLLDSMRIKYHLPVTVRVDNIGAIFMSKNINTSSRTKHVDVRTKYVNEFCENGIIKIIFISSSENISDIMSKNLNADLNAKHSDKLITKRI